MTAESVTPEAWAERLAQDDVDGAWDALLHAYRGLLLSVINALVKDRDERMDAFVAVCDGLRRDDCRRLRAFKPDGAARFSTWLVTVCRHLVVDWYRQTRGRRRIDPALERLPAEQRALYPLLAHRRLSYAEAYEVMRGLGQFAGSYPAFLRLVRELHRAVSEASGPLASELIGTDVAFELAHAPVHLADELPDHERVMSALRGFPEDVQAATLLFVVDELSADDVARIVGWPGRKAVYNRVYRTLAAIRKELESGPEQRPSAGRDMKPEQAAANALSLEA